MKWQLVSITDSEDLARLMDSYLRFFLGTSVDSIFMTYGRSLLSGTLIRQVDLFILELLRGDDIGYRAEGIFTAEKWLEAGKRVLIVSGDVLSAEMESPSYWDLSATDPLADRVHRLLNTPVPPVSALGVLRRAYAQYCRPLCDRHPNTRSEL